MSYEREYPAGTYRAVPLSQAVEGEQHPYTAMSEPDYAQMPKEPRGRFKISREFLRDHWRELRPLFAEVVVVKVSYDFCSDLMEYAAYSDRFDDIELGVELPLYEIHYEQVDGRPVFKGFVRLKDS